MHERSLVRSLLRQIDDELERRRLRHLAEIRLAVGDFSGIELALLESAFAELAPTHWPQPVVLRCERIPLTARCRSCQKEFHVNGFRFVCRHCGGRQLDVIAGEEIRVVSVIAEPIPDSGHTTA